MLYHCRANCNNNNVGSVNDFHIHTEVSSAERGNHLHSARQVCSQGEQEQPLPPLLFYGWMERLDGFPYSAAQLLWGILINHHEGLQKLRKDEMRVHGG